jgi:membrane-bound lytic murein transglycosylase B
MKHARTAHAIVTGRAPAAASAARAVALAVALAAGFVALPAAPARAYDVSRADVRAFVDEVAKKQKLDRTWVEQIVTAAEPKQAIVDAMSRPAERVRPWFEYRATFMTEKRIADGRQFYAEHRDEIEAAGRKTGVAPEVIAAIVGVETFYGRITGRYRVLDALATLAFDYPARAPFFRGELAQFLQLAREQSIIDPLKATGSYAGAMGAPQFMPSSYRTWAVDGDGDGNVDLWNDWPDVFASVGNYLAKHGWRAGEPVYANADLWYPGVLDLPAGRLDGKDTVASLRAKGLQFETALPADARAIFVALRAEDGPSYRVGFNNFYVITRYNRSHMYALAVAELAQAIAAAPAAVAPVATSPAASFVPDAGAKNDAPPAKPTPPAPASPPAGTAAAPTPGAR